MLRRHRHAARLTLEQLAEASGVSARTLSDMERGRSKGPQHRTVTALADALGLADSDREQLVALAREGRLRDHWTRPTGLCELPRPVEDFTGRTASLSPPFMSGGCPAKSTASCGMASTGLKLDLLRPAAAMTGLTFSPFEDGEGNVRAIVDSFGSSDLSAVAADPATYASPSAPPYLLLHGSQDMLISPSQTQHLHQALLAAGATSSRYVVDGANHGDVAFLGLPGSGLPWTTTTTMNVITDFFHRHLNGLAV